MFRFRCHQVAATEGLLMFRITRILLLVAIALFVAVPAASAVPAKKMDDLLSSGWKTVLETPSAQNPFGGPPGGPAFGCVNLGGTLWPIGTANNQSCVVK